jgi:hypothetical protein
MAQNTIQATTDYTMFKQLSGNRQLNKAHINKLKSEFKENTEAVMYTPILVNERFEVIDGQHRLEAVKELELPIFYIQQDGLKLKDAQKLNSLTKSWGPRDWAESYAKLGNKNYIEFVKLMEEYKLPFNVLTKYASGYGTYPNTNMFRNGSFKIGDLTKARDHLNFLVRSGQYYTDYRRKGYGEALQIMLNHPRFDRDRLITALKGRYAQKKLQPFDSMPEYLKVLTLIYNHGLLDKNRIMFFEAAV